MCQPIGSLGVVCDEHTPADERSLLLVGLERRARCVGVAHRRRLVRVAARPQVVGRVVLLVLRELRLVYPVLALLLVLVLEGALLSRC